MDNTSRFNLTTSSKVLQKNQPNVGTQHIQSLPYFLMSIGILNRSTNNSIKVYLQKFSDEFILISPGSYNEFAATTNWYEVEFEPSAPSTDTVVVDETHMANVEAMLTPLFPTLIQNPEDEYGVGYPDRDILYNPINLGGYNWQPITSGTGKPALLGAENLFEMEYWLNGRVFSTNQNNFYQDYFSFLMDSIQSLYPANYVRPINSDYDPVQTAEVLQKVKAFFDSKYLPLNDEGYGGWAALETFDRDLSLATFVLSGNLNPYIEFPFTVLGIVLKNTATSGGNITAELTTREWNDTTKVWEEGSETITLPPNTEVTVNTLQINAITVTTGVVSVRFSGRYVKMTDFAPIINIVYPIGFDGLTDKPSDAFLTFTQALETMRDRLAQNQFTGRVLYFRALPFEAQASPVWNADFIIPEYVSRPFDLVWEEVREEVANWYSPSKFETQALTVIAWENKNIYHRATPPVFPKDLNEAMLNDSVTMFLGTDVSSFAPGTARINKKKDIIRYALLNEYRTGYGRDGINFFYTSPNKLFN